MLSKAQIDLEARFDALNKKYYNGEVKRPSVFYEYNNDKSIGHLAYKITGKRKQPTNICLGINCNVDWDKYDVNGTILHEMVHIHNAMLGLEPKSRAPMIEHNWAFRMECWRLRREFGAVVPIRKPLRKKNGGSI